MTYVTAGTGHRRAAEAVADAARERLPQSHVACVDLLHYTPSWLRWAYPRSYEGMVRRCPAAWAALYRGVDWGPLFWLLQPVRRWWNAAVASAYLRFVDACRPDVIIVTHFFPAGVLADAKRRGRLRSRLIVVVTDLFPHRLWLAPEADAVVVGSDQTQAIYRRRGVADDRLHLLGIPIASAFQRHVDRHAVLHALGLNPSRRTVLMAGGGMGVGPIAALMKRLATLEVTHPHQLQLIVVCGANAGLQHELDRVAEISAMPVRVFGFVETMPELMGAADLLVTKAGGLTVMEALAMGLPMIFSASIPGQEAWNADYAVRSGAAVKARDPDDVMRLVDEFLRQPERLHAMQERARAAGRPRAAVELVDQLIIGHAPS